MTASKIFHESQCVLQLFERPQKRISETYLPDLKTYGCHLSSGRRHAWISPNAIVSGTERISNQSADLSSLYERNGGMKSIVRRRKPNCVKGHAHKVLTNILNREFPVSKPNLIWAADFTYLLSADGTMRYNCTMIDLYDLSAAVYIERCITRSKD